jgi:tetratricopeptide (TPR) repeat protein
VIKRLAALTIVWLATLGAAPVPLVPPPPDVASLIPFAVAPLDKPAVAVPSIPLPPPPVDLPPVRPAVLAVPATPKPTAPLAEPGTAPCLWSWLPSASEQLKCGMARFYRDEHEKAREVLEQAVRRGSERDLLAEARYWLAETLYVLGRPDQADPLFRQVAQEPRQPLAVWALSGSGWSALQTGDAARARDVFARLVAAPGAAAIDPWARHGHALALYALGRFEEAERVWADMLARTPQPALARDVLFWHGETLGRIGRYKDAAAELKRFTDAGAHPLRETGLLRQGWWAVAAEDGAQAVAPLRAVVALPMRATDSSSAERDWADTGLSLALLATNDVDGARAAIEPLRTRRSPLLVPVLLRVAAGVVDTKTPSAAQPLIQELLGGQLQPRARAWALLVAGAALHADGNRDEARTQFDLARQADPSGAIGWHAGLRLSRVNFELREFTQAMADAAPLLTVSMPVEFKFAALVQRAEAAYHAGDYTTAAEAFRRALVDLPQAADKAGVRHALGWTALRQGRGDEARRHFLDFAKEQPEHALAGDAMLLASELALTAGDLEDGRALLERVFTTYATHPRVEFAKLNRAILLLKLGSAAAAQPMLREWIKAAPSPQLVGRAEAALGTALMMTSRHADAAKEFQVAHRQGETALATIGTGATSLAANRLDEAVKLLTDARDAGPAAFTAVAEYGLAVAAYHKGDTRNFAPVARTALATAGPAVAPQLLYVLTGLAVEDRQWAQALDHAKRLVADYSAHEMSDDALERVGSAATSARVWPVVYESYALLLQRYPQSPFADAAMVALAEAQINTGRGGEAVATLEKFVAANPGHPEAARAWLALGRAREAAGDKPAATEAYGAAIRDARAPDVRREAAAGSARILVSEKKWTEARSLLHSIMLDRDHVVVAEAAQAIGETYRGEGDALAAAEYFMTAAYVAPDSPAAKKALLSAAQTLAAAKQGDAAAVVYRKLLAMANLPAEVEQAARQGLGALR